jgi:hypothetical protein
MTSSQWLQLVGVTLGDGTSCKSQRVTELSQLCVRTACQHLLLSVAICLAPAVLCKSRSTESLACAIIFCTC